MSKKIRIAIDAMGGDTAPVSEVEGSLIAAKEKSEELEIILVGKEETVKNELEKAGGCPPVESQDRALVSSHRASVRILHRSIAGG